MPSSSGQSFEPVRELSIFCASFVFFLAGCVVGRGAALLSPRDWGIFRLKTR
jgi:hypothetical protein